MDQAKRLKEQEEAKKEKAEERVSDSEDDNDEDFEREDVRFILQNDVDYVIHSIY